MRHNSKHAVVEDHRTVLSRPVVGAAADIKRQRTTHQQRQDNARTGPQRHTSATKETGTIIPCKVGTLPSPTPATRTAVRDGITIVRGNKDEYDGRLGGGSPQDDPPFGCQSSPTTMAATTCTHPSNVVAAAAPVPGHAYCRDGNNASDNAGNVLPKSNLAHRPADGIPSHLPRWSANETTSPLWCSPCPARATSGNDDVSLLCGISAVSSFLTVRGGR